MKNMTFKKARELMGKTIFKDQNLYNLYISNIATFLWNVFNENDDRKLDWRGIALDEVADELLKLIFLLSSWEVEDEEYDFSEGKKRNGKDDV